MGGYHVYKRASRSFVDDLKGKSSDLVRRLGMVGYIAKGLGIAGAGVLAIVAAIRSEPKKATGLDGALKTLGAQPYGVALLIAAGLGIITYGLYTSTASPWPDTPKCKCVGRFSPGRSSDENAIRFRLSVDFAVVRGTLNSSPICFVRSATVSGLGTDLRWRAVAAC